MRQELRYAWEFREGRKIEACLRQDLRYGFAISGIISDLGYIEVLRHTSRGNEDGLKYLSLGYAPNIEGIPQRNSSYTPSQNRGMPLFEVEVYLAQVIGRYQKFASSIPKMGLGHTPSPPLIAPNWGLGHTPSPPLIAPKWGLGHTPSPPLITPKWVWDIPHLHRITPKWVWDIPHLHP